MPGLHVETNGIGGDTRWQENEDTEGSNNGNGVEGHREGAGADLPLRKQRQEPAPLMPTRTSSTSSIATVPFPDLESPVDTPTATPAPSSSNSPTKARAQPNVTARRDSQESVRKLSASQMQALTSAPESLPIAIVPPAPSQRKPNGVDYPMSASVVESVSHLPMTTAEQTKNEQQALPKQRLQRNGVLDIEQDVAVPPSVSFKRPASIRTLSTPPINRRAPAASISVVPPALAGRRNSFNPLARPRPLSLHVPAAGSVRAPPKSTAKSEKPEAAAPAPTIAPPIPLPPMSLPTHLQLELAGQRPSPLYIYQSHVADILYESSAVKFERLLNALLLPPFLEKMLVFGTLACLDAWLYTFTILPMRFCIALGVLVKWWGHVIWKETRWLLGFVWEGVWRLKRRAYEGKWGDTSRPVSEHERSRSRPRESSAASRSDSTTSTIEISRPKSNANFHPPKHPMPRNLFRHRRTKSTPSDLTPYHKADLLQGAIIIFSSLALINLDASRMYHFIRAQSSMKLYVIYNILEVGDRLLAAIGQDIIECLFSSETLSRNSSGRSKLLLPFGMFILSLIYNVVHVLCLFYQVITLNVAVNSYSNTLLTLLISNQFVEIKGAVFKKIEKENLFQLTCADIVERFQLWIILLIIAMRNIVEVGGLSVPGVGNEQETAASGPGPIHTNSILPHSFTVWPSWLLSGEVLSPFVIVIGIEMLVDWIKHAYINKFNNVRPAVYNRMLDILSKDYYTNAFGTPSLTRRIGLPVLPLSCLFIRASLQIYHMFLSTHLPPPLPTSTMELAVESSTPSSPAVIAALERLDSIIRNALGRSVHGDPSGGSGGGGAFAMSSSGSLSLWKFSSDDAIALLTMLLFFFLAWIVLLLVKLVLGMGLLRYARMRYAAMVRTDQAVAAGREEREPLAQAGTRRLGPWGATEVGDERRRWLYEDDPDGLRRMRDRERKTEEAFRNGHKSADDGLTRVYRYEMGVSKRIW